MQALVSAVMRRINPCLYYNFAYMHSFTCFGVSAVMRKFSNIGVSAARYKITTAKMFAKCTDFHAELIHAFILILHICAALHVLEFLR